MKRNAYFRLINKADGIFLQSFASQEGGKELSVRRRDLVFRSEKIRRKCLFVGSSGLCAAFSYRSDTFEMYRTILRRCQRMKWYVLQ